MNATYVNNYSENVTHIVMQSEHVQGRTMKLMLALAGTCREDGSPFFVNTNFVEESLRSGQLQKEADFKPLWSKEQEKKTWSKVASNTTAI